MTLSERVTIADLDSEHFAAQLIDRLRWAVGDAYHAEQSRCGGDRNEPSLADTTEPRGALSGRGE